MTGIFQASYVGLLGTQGSKNADCYSKAETVEYHERAPKTKAQQRRTNLTLFLSFQATSCQFLHWQCQICSTTEQPAAVLGIHMLTCDRLCRACFWQWKSVNCDDSRSELSG